MVIGRGRVSISAAVGALFSAETVSTGHAALKHALQPHNRTLQLDAYGTVDDVFNRFDFIQTREYTSRVLRSDISVHNNNNENVVLTRTRSVRCSQLPLLSLYFR